MPHPAQYPNRDPKNGAPVNLDEYLPVACMGPSPDKDGELCGCTLWVPQERLICGIHRLARADRSHDIQIPQGVALRCWNCGRLQQKTDIEAAGK